MDTDLQLVKALLAMASGAGVGTVISFLIEKLGFLKNADASTKGLVIAVLFMGLPLAATALLQFVPLSFWQAVEPYFVALAAGFAAWLGSQYAHGKQKEAEARKNGNGQ